MIIIISVMLAYLFKKQLNIPFYDALIFLSIGMTLHVLEDYLVYLTPLLDGGYFTTSFFYGIFNIKIMVLGLELLCGAVIIRYKLDGGWEWVRQIYIKIKEQLPELKQDFLSVKNNKKNLVMVGLTIIIVGSVGCIYYNNTVNCNNYTHELVARQQNNTTSFSYVTVSNDPSLDNIVISDFSDHFVRIRTYCKSSEEYIISNTTLSHDNITLREVNVSLMKNTEVINYTPDIDHIYLLSSNENYTLTVDDISFTGKKPIILYNASVRLNNPNASEYRLDV